MTVSVPFVTTSTTTSRRCGGRAPLLAAFLVVAALLAACTDDPDTTTATGPDEGGGAEVESCAPEALPEPLTVQQVVEAETEGTTVRLITHDSFAVSDGIFDDFTEETGIEVELLTSGDTGTLVSQAVLTSGNPVADVLFGIDTTFLCRGTRAGLFTPYAPEALAGIDASYRLDPDDLVTPIDVGDVCLNYSRDRYPDDDEAPADLQDLADPEFRDQFVTQNPETSSPGFAFLLATISAFGADGWEQYWEDLRANGVRVEPGWEQAYYDAFEAGDGDRSIVTSYATSPVADVLYSDPPRDEPAIGVVSDSCFRQVEFAGILRGTDQPEAAARLIDFLLSPRFQEDIPLNMFVEPVNPDAEIPSVFEAHRTVIAEPLTLTPAEIEAGRDGWTEQWTQIVLR